jgi:hypothetical protein
MKVLQEMALALWVLLGLPLVIIGVLTALTLVFSILGVVSMFIALAVPFGLAPPLLDWMFRKR